MFLFCYRFKVGSRTNKKSCKPIAIPHLLRSSYLLIFQIQMFQAMQLKTLRSQKVILFVSMDEVVEKIVMNVFYSMIFPCDENFNFIM